MPLVDEQGLLLCEVRSPSFKSDLAHAKPGGFLCQKKERPASESSETFQCSSRPFRSNCALFDHEFSWAGVKNIGRKFSEVVEHTRQLATVFHAVIFFSEATSDLYLYYGPRR